MGPQNAVIGQDNPVQLPQTQVPEQDLTREKQMASFAASEEFEKLSNFMQGRMDVWRGYIPGASGSVTHMDELGNEERGWRWLAADAVIREFQGVINAYQQASEVLKSAHEPTE